VAGVAALVLGGAGLAGAAILRLANPVTAPFYPVCVFHQATGMHCPGCGTARALHALLNGRFVEALGYNPVATVLLPLLGVMTALELRRVWQGREPYVSRVAPWLAWGLVLLMAAFWVARNIPAYPFTLLAP
jgi:hypothetical protein